MVAKKNPKITLQSKQEFTLKLAASYENAFPSFYSNYAALTNTPTEICIDFCVMAPPHKVIDQSTVGLPVVARVLVPSQMAKGLIKALEVQLQKHEDSKKNNIMLIERKK